jgi:small subunit ribosomal protein S9
MADEPEQQDEQPQDEAPQEEGPQEEAPQEDAPQGEVSPEEAPEEEAAADEADQAEDAATEGPEEPEAEATEGAPAAAEEPEKPAEASKDLPPGAELEPITLEPEGELSAEERARREAEEEERARREAEATAEAPEEQDAAAPRTPAELAGDARYLATGKRKRSIARVVITPGDGKFEINRRPLQEYFPRPLHQSTALQPLTVSGFEGTVDVRVNVRGGGIGGQAGAIRHGIARALTEIDPQLRKELKRRGFLTRDARVKERRKAGLKKARKRPQFSKR